MRPTKLNTLILSLLISLLAIPEAFAGDGVPLFLPFQGRATDNAGQPINLPATFKFRFYPAGGACYIYEETQSITPNGYGFFSVVLGGLANRTGPVNSFADVFNNDATVNDSCASTFNGTANEWRRLEIVVDGVALPTMQTIAASAFSINSNMLDGKTSADYLQVAGAVTQANMATLVGAGDASALHHHDGRYVTLSGNNSIAGNITSTGSFYGVGAGSTIGIGTSSPIADIEIRRTNPSMLLGATSGGGGTPSITFTSGATQRARIQASESTNEMRFYTGSTEAMRLDASQNLILTGSLQVGGTVGLGKYNNAQETTLVTTLGGMGAAAVGTMWVNSQTNTFKFWDGSQAIGLGASSYITSVTAGTGLTNSGTATAPILNVAYGTAGGTAIQGNAAFAGDVTGAYTGLAVVALRGRSVSSTAPTNGQLLTWNTSNNAWTPLALTDAQLGSNVALKDAANIFTNQNTIQVPTATSTALILQSTDNNATNNVLSIRNSTNTPVATVRFDGVPTAVTDLTTKNYVDTQDANKLSLSGGTMSGAINMGANQITNMADPTANQHAATKFYADTHLATRNVASTAPGANQILKWNGSQWEPAADVDTGITALTGDVSASGNGSVAATIANGAIDSNKILDGAVSTVDIGALQVTDAKIAAVSVGKITSPAGAYFTYAPNAAACSANQILKWNGSAWLCGTDNNAGGTVTLVSGGAGLLGGNISLAGTLAVDVGTGPGQIVQLNGSSQLPAIDGSLLTFINATQLRGSNIATTAPTLNQVLTWNGSAWAPAAAQAVGVTLVTGGTGLVGGPISSTGTLSVNVGTGANQIVQLNGSSQIPALDGSLLNFVSAATLRGFNISTTAPTANQVLAWNGSAWAPATDGGGDITQVNTTAPLLGGGSSGGLTLSIDTGVTTGQIVQVAASNRLPVIDGSNLTFVNAATLRGINLSGLTPTLNQVLKYNGSAWEASSDVDTGITALSGDVTASGSGSVAATIRNDRVTTAMMKSAGGGINRILITDSTTGGSVTFADTCANGDVMKWGGAGAGWACASDVGAAGVVTSVTGGTGTTGGVITSVGTISVDVGTGPNKIVQLNGSSQIPAIDGSLLTFVSAASLRGNNVSAAAPSLNQVLAWNGSAWAPTTDGGGDMTQVNTTAPLLGGGSSGGLTLSIDTGVTTGQIVQVAAANKLPVIDGSNLTFVSAATLRGVNLSATAPTSGFVLKYNGSAWEAAADTDSGGDITQVQTTSPLLGGGSSGGLTLSIDTGTSANKILQLNGSAQIPAVDGSLLTFVSAASLRGNNISAAAPSLNQVLAWNGTAWAPASDGGGDITQVSTTSPLLGGGTSGGLTLSIDAGTGPNQILQLNGSSQIPAVDGSLLTSVNAASLRGTIISTTAPIANQILQFNGSAWIPTNAAATGVTLVAVSTDLTGGPISSTGTLGVNTGTGANQIVKLNGLQQIPAVDGSLLTFVNAASIRGTLVSSVAPTTNFVLKYNGSAWIPSADADSGGDMTQVQTTSPLLGGGSSGGLTLSIDTGVTTGQIVQVAAANKLPVIDGSNLTNVSAAQLRGVNLSATAPSSGFVLKYNGSAWEAAADTDSGGDITQVSTTAPLLGGGTSGGLTLSIDTGTTANKILQLNGSAQIPAVDGSLLTFINAASLRGVNISATAPTSNQVLQYNGSAWAAATLVDSGITALSGDVTASGSGSVTATIRNDRIATSMIKSSGGGVNRLIKTDSSTGTTMDFATCADNELLKWNSSTGWGCATDTGGLSYVATSSDLTGGPITSTGTIGVNTGTGANQIVKLNGSSQIPAVDGSLLTFINAASIRGVNVSATAPSTNFVLKYNGSAWAPAADSDSGGDITEVATTAPLLGGGSTGGLTLSIDTGTTANKILQLNGSAQIPAVDGSLLTLVNASSLRGTNVSATAPATTGQILMYNGSAWAPSTPTFANTFALNSILYASSADTVTGLASLTGRVLTSGPTGIPVWSEAPSTTNNALKWNGSQWEPQVDDAAQIQGRTVASTAPTVGQVLRWNGSEWQPAAQSFSASKSANETRTNNTLASDSVFTFTAVANTNYYYDMTFSVTNANATPDFRAQFSVPVGATYTIFGGITNANSPAFSSTTVTLNLAAGTIYLVRYTGNIVVGATGGTVEFQWAQNVTDGANATTIQRGNMIVSPY